MEQDFNYRLNKRASPIFNPGFLAADHAPWKIQPMVNIIGSQILEALERLGKTQSWLAEQAEVSDTAVTKWIQTGKIRRENASRVARVLGISIDQLLHGAADSFGERLSEPLDALPPEFQQEVLDFIRYKFERAEHMIASDKVADYNRMIERITADMERLKKDGAGRK